jgi:hypothetical protein
LNKNVKKDQTDSTIYRADDLFKTKENKDENKQTNLTSVSNYAANHLTNLGVDSWGWNFPSTLWNNSRLSDGSGAASGDGVLQGPGNSGISKNSQKQQLPVADSSSSTSSHKENNQRNSYAPAYADTPIDNYSSYGALSSQGQSAQYLPVTADFSAFRK